MCMRKNLGNEFPFTVSLEKNMFSLFKKDPLKKLNQEYTQLLEQALAAQRKGDIRTYSDLTSKAELVADQIDRLKEA